MLIFQVFTLSLESILVPQINLGIGFLTFFLNYDYPNYLVYLKSYLNIKKLFLSHKKKLSIENYSLILKIEMESIIYFFSSNHFIHIKSFKNKLIN